MTDTSNQHVVTPFTFYDAYDRFINGDGTTVYVNPDAYMNSGPGSSISLLDFFNGTDIVSFNQSPGSVIPIDKKYTAYHYTDHAVDLNYLDAAYIWGSSSYRLKGSVTVVARGAYEFSGYIRPFDENFDFVSNVWYEYPFKATAGFLTEAFAGKQGVGYEIAFVGGKGRLISQAFSDVEIYSHDFRNLFEQTRCFPAGTPVTLADGSTLPIEDIVAGVSKVASFDAASGFGREALESKPVIRLYENVTTEWVVFAANEDWPNETQRHAA